MFRFLRTLILVLIVAALSAAGVLLLLSRDPYYVAREWAGGSRFWQYDDLIRDAGKRHGVDPMLIKAVIWRESRFHPDKVGSSGERGLMQVMEGAAQDWVRSEKIENFMPTDLFDPKMNIEVGTWYLRKGLERWKNRDNPVPFALAEYNAGRTRVDRWISESKQGDRATAADLLAAIDYPSTRRYIEEISKRYQQYRERGRL